MTTTDYESVPAVERDAAAQSLGTIVMKFGGTSVADAEKLKSVARRLVAARESGARVVAVLSAMGRTTDELLDLAEALALISVAITAIRHSPWLEALAAIAGTLLCTDAWFDITLEWGGKHMVSSIVEAATLELPLAAICFWVASDAERALARALPAPWRRAAIRALLEPDESPEA